MSATWVKRGLAVLLLAAIVAAILNIDRFDPRAIEAEIRALGWWAPVVFVALFVMSTALLGSATFAMLIGGALFGPWWGFALNMGGAVAGALLNFVIGRYLATDWLRKRAGGRLRVLLEGVEDEGWRFVTFVRLVPIFQFAALGYLLGATKVRFSHYLWPTVICLIPGAIAWTWIGHTGREAAEGREGLVQDIMLAVALLAVVAFLPRFVRRARGRVGIGRDELDTYMQHHPDALLATIEEESSEAPSLPREGAQVVRESDLNAWIAERGRDPSRRIVIAATREATAIRVAERLRKAGVLDVRHLKSPPA